MHGYFHCCSLPLADGSVINPGNWGRMIRLYTQQNGSSWVLARELAYENVRLESFPDKPSRFEGLFVCENAESLKEFCNNNNRLFDILYEVNLVKPDAKSHRGDWTTVNNLQTDNLPAIRARANLYWSGADIVKAELLTLSPIRIVRQLA